MLQLQNVTKIYETKAEKVRAIDGISLTFPSSGLVFTPSKGIIQKFCFLTKA